MDDTLRRCLDDLERRIEPDQEERTLKEWIEFSEGRFDGEMFSPRRQEQAPPAVEWPRISVNQALDDYDAMALHQFGECSRRLADADGLLLCVRCNYGTSILPSLFGAEPFVMDEELDTLPTSRPLPGVDAIKRVLGEGVPELGGGHGAKVLEMDEFGGGAIHFCGRGDHYIESMSEIAGLHAIHMSQPEYNDMEIIFTHTVDKGIKLIGLGRTAAEDALARARSLHGQVHCA